MEFYDAIYARRSVRAYHADLIPEDALTRILEATRRAPSACNLQPWRFLVLKSPASRATACECYPGGAWLKNAPVIVVALGSPAQAWKRLSGASAHTIDVSIAMEHLVLAATAEGLGTCWICAFDQGLLHRKFRLAPEWEVIAMTPLGYPNDEPRPCQRKNLDEIVSFL